MKRILFVLLALILLLVGGVLGAFFLTPSSTVAAMAASRVKDATGRTLTIEGDIARTLYPSLGVVTGPVTLSNASWAGQPAMISAKAATIRLRTLPLIGGGVEIEEIRFVEPVVHLEVSADGLKNWELGADEPVAQSREAAGGAGDEHGGPGGGPGALPLIESAAIVDGLVTYTDAATGQTVALEDLDLALSLPAPDAAMTVEGGATISGERVTLSMALDTPAALRAGGQARANATLAATGVSGRFDGAFTPGADAPQAAGDLALLVDPDPAKTAWLRGALPPEFADLGGVDVKGRFSATPAALDVDLTGLADLKGQRTEIRARAQAGEGWTTGASAAVLDVSAKNGLVDAGYDGTAVLAEGGTPQAKGAWRLRAPDVAALSAWAGRPAPAEGDPLGKLGSVDLAGELDVDAGKALATLGGAVGYGGRDVTLSGRVDGGADWRDGGPVRSELTAASAGLFDLRWSGETRLAAAGPDVAGDLSFTSEALRAFAEWAGAGPIEAPKGSFERIALTTKVVATPTRSALESLDVTLDDDKVTGDVSVAFDGERPKLDARVVTSALDLRPFTQGGGSAGSGGGAASGGSAAGGGGSGGGWSTDPLDLGALQLVDADIDLTTDGLATNVITIGKSRILATLVDGALKTEIREMALYGGTAKGVATVGSRGEPSIGADLEVAGVAIRPLLTDTSGLDWIEGTGAMTLDIAGQGASMAAIMRSLDGSASIDFRDGAIIGYNLAAIVRNITSLGTAPGGEEQKTDFAEMGGTFAIKDGVAANDDFTMMGPLVRLTGSGTIDIGAQTLNYRAVPKAVATLEGQGGAGDLKGIAFPLLITGPWSAPSIVPDLAGGALQSVEGLLADPEGAASFLKDLGGGGDLGGALDSVLGGGDQGGGSDLGGALDSVLGGGSGQQPASGGGSAKPPLPDPADALKGLFGN